MLFSTVVDLCAVPIHMYVYPAQVPLLVETFGGCAPPLMSALQRAADWRQNKLTSSEYDETTWSARTWLSFVSQRLSVATQLAAAQEVAEALGLSVAADPRLQ